METFFADSFFYKALLNKRDAAHQRTVDFLKGRRFRSVTTEFVVTEVGDDLCRDAARAAFLAWLDQLRQDGLVRIVPATTTLLGEGIEHFRRHKDKHWGLTDCVSFVIMASEGISEALTGDRHFEQAGFVALLRED